MIQENELLYVIPAGKYGKEGILSLLAQYPEIKYVSLMGIDLAGNDTDEKIPIELFFKNYNTFFSGEAVQTDGSSVVLTNIATLNNAKVDIVADPDVNWIVDYNWQNIDPDSGRPIGTLRIPSFLVHDGEMVDSRSILKRTIDYVNHELLALMKEHSIPGMEHVQADDIDELLFTTATELEFWVKTPSQEIDSRVLSVSQRMQEQYWQRTHGAVRTAMEESIEMLKKMGLEPEMGHKEVGGVKPRIDDNGRLISVLEQLEIDWRYQNSPLQTADNELEARIIIREVFRKNGLEVTFKAKPIIGVAGSGKHTHIGLAARMKNGRVINLFAPQRMEEDFLSVIGYGALMGMLHNYEIMNPFVSSTNDALNRLKPGFEAPVAIVTSLGKSPTELSRNRSVLIGLIRDMKNPLATRLELRSPNPYTNTYTCIALCYLAALDGIRYAVESNKESAAFLKELSKEPGEAADYLDDARAYRTENDLFVYYTEEERSTRFSCPPTTVWENIRLMKQYPDKKRHLAAGDAFSERLMDSFLAGVIHRWKLELYNRIITENNEQVRACKRLNNENELDESRWRDIDARRHYLAKDRPDELSLLSRIRAALRNEDYDTASKLQVEMNEKMIELDALYYEYRENLID